MVDGQGVQTLRVVLLPYFQRLMQFDPGREHPDPKLQQIVLVSWEALAHLMW